MKWQSLNKKPLLDQLGEWWKERKAAKAAAAGGGSPPTPGGPAPAPPTPPTPTVEINKGLRWILGVIFGLVAVNVSVRWWNESIGIGRALLVLTTCAVLLLGWLFWKERRIEKFREWIIRHLNTLKTELARYWKTMMRDTNEEGERISPASFWRLVGFIYAALIALDIFLLVQKGHEWKIGQAVAITWNWGMFLLLLKVAHAAASIRMIGPQEIGARFFWGKPLHDLTPGPVFVPLGICQLATEDATVQQDELPAPPEKIFRVKEAAGEETPEADVVPADLVEKGFKPPIRITFGFPGRELRADPEASDEEKRLIARMNEYITAIKNEKSGADKEEKTDPFDSRLTAEVFVVIRWRILRFCQFFSTIMSMDEARKQMEDTTTAMLTRAFAKITPAVALEHLGTQSGALLEEIRERVGQKTPARRVGVGSKPWGVSVETAQIKLINFSHKLNKRVQEMAEAQAERRAKITRAEGEGERKRIERKGEGLGEEAYLAARGRGLQQMAQLLNLPATIIVGAEVARTIGENPQKTIIIPGSGGLTDLLGMAAAIGQTLGTGSGGVNAPPPIPPRPLPPQGGTTERGGSNAP